MTALETALHAELAAMRAAGTMKRIPVLRSPQGPLALRLPLPGQLLVFLSAEAVYSVDVLVEEVPPPELPDLLGLYEGIPLTRRGMGYSGVLPDRITLFSRNIEAAAGSEERLPEVIRDTIVHEIAHFFGISDERLLEMGRD